MGNHGKEAHLALESQIWSCLTNPLVATTQRLDWGKKNQKNTKVWIITTKEQTLIEKGFWEINFGK